MPKTAASKGPICSLWGERIKPGGLLAHRRTVHKDFVEATKSRGRLLGQIVVGAYVLAGGTMLFGVLAAPMPWKSFLIVAPMWAFLSTAGATYLYMARFSAALSAGLPWRCPICDSQVPRGTRRGHMIQAHGPEAGLPWILRRLAGV